jgi:hypothetical protein
MRASAEARWSKNSSNYAIIIGDADACQRDKKYLKCNHLCHSRVESRAIKQRKLREPKGIIKERTHNAE